MRDQKQRYEESAKTVLLCIVLTCFMILFAVVTGCTTNVAPIKVDHACEKLELPPLPQKAVIKIDGNSVDADEGGQTILKYYVAARRILK